jgi:hypothetical protein
MLCASLLSKKCRGHALLPLQIDDFQPMLEKRRIDRGWQIHDQWPVEKSLKPET